MSSDEFLSASAAGASAQKAGALGVIAGRGALPRLVAEAEHRRGGNVFVIALRGFAEGWTERFPSAVAGLGQVGRIFSLLKAAGCDRVCFAGGLQRPSLFNLRFDFTALRVAPMMARLLRKGDDGLLRGLAAIFESRGYQMVGAHELLGDLVAPQGRLGARAPSHRDLEDAARAADIVAALGRVDVGQGAIVAHGRCLAVETVQGTDAMLRALVGDKRRAGAPIPSGVLLKAPKPGQDMRMDMPAVGPDTMLRAKEAGLNGVVVAAGGVIILDIAATAAAADKANIFLYGWEPAAEPAAQAPQPISTPLEAEA
ncbi:MAG: UDP-2,3-diacylglucosamine diphosphatase LpxI [Neomegalonema sp.]|nr:UDP-2,3-diacylglucosamine diphosphatase LpxI [Neomegalonema sp.]